MSRLRAYVPLLVTLVAALSVVAAVARGVRDPAGIEALPAAVGRIPVSAEGRTKPLDSFARGALLKISGKQTASLDTPRSSASRWLLEIWTSPSQAAKREVIRIDHPGVLALMNTYSGKRTRFSFAEVEPAIGEIVRQAQLASELPRSQRDSYQRAVLDLHAKLTFLAELYRFQTPYAVAPLAGGEEWRPFSDVNNPGQVDITRSESFRSVSTILARYQQGDAEGVRDELGRYQELLRGAIAPDLRKARLEVAFSRCRPFILSAALYVGAFLLGCAGLLAGAASPAWAGSMRRGALGVLLVAFVVHTAGLAIRIYLQGRPPVTNLYSSAVFIGWACVPMALAGEWFHRVGIASLAASVVGFGTLVIAHNLSLSGDTMEMMQAVLDSNFWLSTHVVTITIGYSAVFLAGLLACVYVIVGAATPLLRGDGMKALPRMIYGTVCFATILSFVGTVLGGIWADQSWGRFWGWDPKENGAALIVLWNLLILHARWGGMIRERGIAALAICGNIVTAWSWFGTNMLGVGLHSYGFMDSAAFWLIAFCFSQLVLALFTAFLPQRSWISLREPSPRTPQAVAPPPHAPAQGDLTGVVK
jgi:ABC-type transport system involved in cytochrome c biogenesis permease subunit